MSIKQEILGFLKQYLEGRYTWGGKYTTWLPFRDPDEFKLRVALTTQLQADLEAFSDDVLFARRAELLFKAYERNIDQQGCTSRSLDMMRKDIDKCLDKQFDAERVAEAQVETETVVTDNPVFQRQPKPNPAPVDPASEPAGDRLVEDAERHVPGAGEEKGSDMYGQDALALVVSDQPWRYRHYVDEEALPEERPSALPGLLRHRAQLANGFVHNYMMTERGVRNFSSLNYFKRLGVERYASAEDIKHAYHKLSLKFHPDKVREPEQRQYAVRLMGLVNQAYQVLQSDEARPAYVGLLLSEHVATRASVLALDDDEPGMPGCLALWSLAPALYLPTCMMLSFQKHLARGIGAVGDALDKIDDAMNEAYGTSGGRI